MSEELRQETPPQLDDQSAVTEETPAEKPKLTPEQIQQLLDRERKRLKHTGDIFSLKRMVAIMIAFLVILAGLFWLASQLATGMAPEGGESQTDLNFFRFLMPVLIVSLVLVVIVYLARRLTRF